MKGNKDEVNALDYSYKPTGTVDVSAHHNDKPEEDGIHAFEDNGGFGFKDTDGGIMVPCQFGDANDFYLGRAIVAMGGKYGIIELLKGKLDANWSDDRIRVYEYANEVEPIKFTLEVPASLESGRIKLELDKGDGRYAECSGLSCNFKVADQIIDRKRPNCTLHAKASYFESGFPNLLLLEGEQPIEIEYINLDLSGPSVTSEYADENDNQTVKAVVTNTSSIPVKVSATLNVAGKTTPFNGELKPNQSKTLMVTLKVDNDKSVTATISAKVDNHNCGSKSSTVSLKKI